MENVKDEVILVTGVAGFIGSHIAEECLRIGYKVKGIDNFCNGTRENIKSLLQSKNFEFYEGDIVDFKTCLKICKNVSYVFHEAALGSVPRSIKEPLKYTKNNIVGMHNMLEAALKCNIKKFIYASSSSVYGDNLDTKKRIGREGNVLSPYALTKKVDEEMAKLYFQIYGLNTIGLRYFNVFGERQKINSIYAAVIPKFINSIINNQEIVIYGDGNQSRDFTYVKNVVTANVSIIKNDNKNILGKVYNVACENSITINELYEKISNYLNKKTVVRYSEKRKGDIERSMADLLKTKNELNYVPLYDFDFGIKKTIEWFLQENKKRNDTIEDDI